MKTADDWTDRLDFGLFHRMSKTGADPLLWGEARSVIKQIQAEALKWAADQIITDGNPDVAREKIMQQIQRVTE